MSLMSLMPVIQRLSVSVETLAAVGAALRVGQDGLDGEPRLRALLAEVVRAIDPQLLDGVDADQAAAAHALIQTVLRQALDLLENPVRVPGWSYDDPLILQSQGQISRLIVRMIDAAAAQRPDLGAALRSPGAFLDVGTGVGWLAIEAARTWPALRVVGIDPWEPALTLARANIEKSGYAGRIDPRALRVEGLDEDAEFSLAWLPGPFIAAEVAVPALARVHRALRVGGWVVFGLMPQAHGPMEEALLTLRIVRSGGHPWTPAEVEERLRALDFERIETFSPTPSITFVVGRR